MKNNENRNIGCVIILGIIMYGLLIVFGFMMKYGFPTHW